MWINRMHHCLLLLICVVLVSGTGFSAFTRAEQGQYRSKVLLSPDGEMNRGAELSIEELEQQIKAIDQPYAKSSAGRHLARHYVEQGEYDKAIEYYQTALVAQGLSDIANREMLRELAQVYLLKEDYSAAVETLERALRIELVPEVGDYLLLAQAHYRLGKYVAVVATLDRMREQDVTLNTAQLRQALALYYRAGAYAQCESLLQQLLTLEPDNPENWHLLVSVYLQQNKKRQALDQLALAREKVVPFTERDTLLLADLQAANKNPYAAAEILSAALVGGKVDASGDNYRKLFEFWFLAREKNKAQQALARATQLTGDTELYLYLARLQMEQQAWQDMHQTVLAACAKQLEDRYVSRANLLLGVSQLKLGDIEAARRSLINASMIGGAHAQAGQWLEFMHAEPATRDELRRIVSVCYGAEDKRASVPATAMAAATPEGGTEFAGQGAAFETKTIPAIRLYYIEQDVPLEQMMGQLKSLGLRLNIALVKSGGTAAGPLHIIFPGPLAGKSEAASLQLALPARGVPSARGRYKSRRTESFKCAYLVQEGPASELAETWTRFAVALLDAGYELTGERRVVIGRGAGVSDTLKTELQLGIH
jgi:tetratricopeptide (TPR) repeat protein